MQRNISLRSTDAICSPVVKGRNVGSVCANSCELTAYIGLPFCCLLASQPLHRASIFVCLYPHSRFSLCSPNHPPPPCGDWEGLARDSNPREKKNRAEDRVRRRERVHAVFVHSQEFDYIRWF